MIQEFFSSLVSKIIIGIISIGVLIGSTVGVVKVAENFQAGAVIPQVVALFSTTLASEITSTATSMTLTSGTTEDSTTLSGTYGFVIDEGTSSEEFVLATCADTACTSMTRGVSSITGNTSVTALKSSHARGASVKISDHPQLAIVSRVINGDESFPNALSFDGILSYTSSGISSAFIGTSIVDKTYVDTSVLSGGANASTTVKGIVEEATDAELAAGTAAGGTSARLFANGASFTQTPTASKVPVALATGLLADGWLGLTTAGDMCYSDGSVLTRLALGTSGYFLTAGATAPAWTQYANLSEANTAFGSTDISGAELEDLSDAGSTIIHKHPIGSGSFTRTNGDGTGTQDIAHGLGATPSFVEIKCLEGSQMISMGTGTATNAERSLAKSLDAGGGSALDADSIICLDDDSTFNCDSGEANITTLDATNITLTWGTAAAANANCIWTAQF